MIRTKKEKLKKKYVIFLIIYFVFLAIYISSITLSKYMANMNKEDSTYSVAKPIIIVEIDPLNNKVNPVNDIEIDFSVYNYDGDDVNDVALKYKISLINDSVSIPLSYRLYDANDNEITLNNNLITTNAINMIASTKTKHDYKLVVSWNGSNSYNYQSLTRNLSIRANVVQLELE